MPASLLTPAPSMTHTRLAFGNAYLRILLGRVVWPVGFIKADSIIAFCFSAFSSSPVPSPRAISALYQLPGVNSFSSRTRRIDLVVRLLIAGDIDLADAEPLAFLDLKLGNHLVAGNEIAF